MIWPMVTGVGAVAYRLRLTPSTRLPSWFLLPSEWVNGPDVVEPNCGPDLLKHLARLEGFEAPAFWSVGSAMGSPTGRYVSWSGRSTTITCQGVSGCATPVAVCVAVVCPASIPVS